MSGLKNDSVKENEEKAKKLMLHLEEMLPESQTGWLFGLDEPSALDTHLVVFIARMCDVNRPNLIPERLQQYGKRAMASKTWQDLMKGTTTTGF